MYNEIKNDFVEIKQSMEEKINYLTVELEKSLR